MEKNDDIVTKQKQQVKFSSVEIKSDITIQR